MSLLDDFTTWKNNNLQIAKKQTTKAVDNFTTWKNNNIQIVKKQVSTGVDNFTTAKNKLIKNVNDKMKKLKINFNLGFLALLPFKVTMVKALQRKGVKNVSTSDNIGKIAMLFHDVIIKGKQHIEFAYYEQFNHVDELVEFGDQLMDSGVDRAATAASGVTGGVVTKEQTKGIIGVIIEFIKGLFFKKDAGQQLPPDQNAIFEDASNEAQSIDVNENGDIVEPWYSQVWVKVLGGVLLAVIVFLLIKKLMK